MGSIAYIDYLSKDSFLKLIDNVEKHNASDMVFRHSAGTYVRPIEEAEQQQLINQKIKEIWMDKLPQFHMTVNSRPLIEKHFDWLLMQAKRRVFGDKFSPITTVRSAAKILKHLENYEIIAGRGLSPFEFLKADPTLCKNEKVATILRFCFSDPSISMSAVGSAISLRDMLLKIDPELLQCATDTCQSVLKLIYKQLEQDPGIHPQIASSTVNHILAIMALFSLQDSQILSVPLYNQSQWQLIDYKVKRLQISSKTYPLSPYYAYGLLPVMQQHNAPAHLLFMGTTYPSFQGGVFTYLADIHPFKSVGGWGFNQGREVIEDFLRKAYQLTGVKSHIVGASLGGSMALHTAIGFRDIVGQVHAFVPAALLQSDIQEWDTLAKANVPLPEVHVYRQQYDHVPLFGNAWGKGWNINYTHGFPMTNALEGHVRIGTACKEVVIARVKENVRLSWMRNLLETIRRIVGFILFSLAIVLIGAYAWLKSQKALFSVKQVEQKVS